MFRIWRKKAEILVAERPRAIESQPAPFEHLPFIDNETLDRFLAEPANVELLPVDPYEYRPELQRLIVSAFFHDASTRAKEVHAV
jgi:hypothetical protein